MSEYVYLYRMVPTPPASPQEGQERMKRWREWMKGIEGHIVSPGHPLGASGSVAKKGSVNDGPYAETKDIVMGFTVIRAKDLAEATKLSAGCPILEGGGIVEVRPILEM